MTVLTLLLKVEPLRLNDDSTCSVKTCAKFFDKPESEVPRPESKALSLNFELLLKELVQYFSLLQIDYGCEICLL